MLRAEALEDRTVPVLISWVCGDGDWATPACWDLNRLPQADDDALIDRPEIVTVTHSAGTSAIRSLLSEEPFVLAGGTLSLAADSALNSSFRMTGGALGGAGVVTVNGPLTWTGGDMQGSPGAPPGRTEARGGLVVGGADRKRLQSRVLENHAGAVWSGPDTVEAYDTGGVVNGPGATFTTRGTVVFVGQRVFANPLFLNDGLLHNQSGTVDFTGQGTFVNRGEVQAEGDVAWRWTGLSATGTFTLLGGTLGFRASTQTLAATTAVRGDGDVVFRTDGTILAGTYDVSGDLTLLGGQIDVTSPRLRVGGQLTVDFGFVNLSGVEVEAGAVLVADGRLTLGNGSGVYCGGVFFAAATVVVGPDSWVSALGPYVQDGGTTALVGGYLRSAEAVWVARGTLVGTGFVDAPLWNQGRVAPGVVQAAGTLTVAGYYWQDAGAELAARLGGSTPGTYDRLEVYGEAFLDGTLRVALFRDFTPHVPDRFEVLTAAELYDTRFAEHSLPDLDPGERLDPVYDDRGLTLVVVPDRSPPGGAAAFARAAADAAGVFPGLPRRPRRGRAMADSAEAGGEVLRPDEIPTRPDTKR